ncbi:MAG TPA: hypothetical protein VKQ11_16975 [Candidatus Sulfotelmatobacter sp.]|nr:hypothetical protein [Candidatus Sulfotelmatobacter sp.]
MSCLKLAGCVIAFTLPLCAQQKLNERQLGAYKGDDPAVRSVMDYCDAVDEAVQGQQPRIFVDAIPDSSMPSKKLVWMKFASREEWDAARKPAPVAFVWNRDGAIVRVTVVSRPPRVGAPSVGRGRIDYCYGADSRLTRIRALWYAPTYCEVLFPCRLISDQLIIGPRLPAVTDWVITEDGAIQKLRNGKAEQNDFDPSYSLTAGDLHLKTSADLPFNQ